MYLIWTGWIDIAYGCDGDVDGAVGEEPVHEGPFRGHHVRIAARLLGLSLMFT